MDDAKRGHELAELARQFILWLRKNELPQLPGLRSSPLDHFKLYAGVYRKASWIRGLPTERKLPPGLAMGSVAEQRRFAGLRLGGTHVLLVAPHEAKSVAPNGQLVRRNRIVDTSQGLGVDRPGAFKTMDPLLDSLEANEKTIASMSCFDFTSIEHRADLVWDDAAEGVRSGVKYRFIFSYETPRRAYLEDVQKLLVPTELQASSPQVTLQRTRQYKEHLYHHATYFNAEIEWDRDEMGEYYRKWKADEPFNPKQRQFKVDLLTDKYLKQCFREFVMKEDDDLLMIAAGPAKVVYRLLWEPPKRTQPAPMRFSVQYLLTIGDPPTPAPKGKDADRDETGGTIPFVFPVRAVIFHAIDGGKNLPDLRFANLSYPSSAPIRFIADYKGLVRWYYDKPYLDLGNDETWFQSFVDLFFGDSSYIVDMEGLHVSVDRGELFLKTLKAESTQGNGPVQKKMKDLVDWCEANPDRYVFTKGMRFGGDENPRELMGVSPTGDVYEWYPQTGIVTRMHLTDWLRDFQRGFIFAEVYKNTAGMLPFITLITWGGAMVMGGAVLGLGAPLAQLARTTVPEIARQVSGKLMAKQAARKAVPQLIAFLVENVMSLMPQDDNKYYQFLKGVVHGFGSGAVVQYLSEIDNRIERQAKLIPEVAANMATKGGYRAYLIYRKVSSATVKITGVIKALRVALADKNARLVADKLTELSKYLGAAFLMLIFILVYLDFVISHETADFDKWVDKQRAALQHMVKETGAHVSGYLDDVRAEIKKLRDSKQPLTTEMLRNHDEKLAKGIKGSLAKGAREVAAVADVLFLLLKEMGIEDWDDLKRHGFTDLLAEGFDALPKSSLVPDIANKLGQVLGEFIGTIVLERRIVPKDVRGKSSWIYGRRPHDLAQGALAGGPWRALWHSMIHPFRDLGELPEALKRGLEEAQGIKSSPLSQGKHKNTAYRDLIRDLLGDEDALARRLLNLADNDELRQRFDTMTASAAAKITPPSLAELLKADNPKWPSDAVLFFLYCWLRVGLHEVLKAFDLMEDDNPFQGKFKLSELVHIIGLHVPIDDETVASLKAVFTKAKKSM